MCEIGLINFYAPIRDDTIAGLMKVVANMEGQGANELWLCISSGGGDLAAGFTAYQFLRNTGLKLTTYNLGNVESSAIMPYLAGDIRLASHESMFFFHPFTWNFQTSVTIATMREKIERLEHDSERYANIFHERTQGDFDIRNCLSERGRVMNTSEASRWGLVNDNTTTIRLPATTLRRLITIPS